MTSITPIAVIHREAEAAAKQALCPAQACRWPQETPQAQEWMRCYRQVRAQIAEPDARNLLQASAETGETKGDA